MKAGAFYNPFMTDRSPIPGNDDILQATHRVVSRLGAGLKLVDIAREAGVPPATLRKRFGSRRGLLLASAAAASEDVSQFARVRAAHRSPLAAVYGIAACEATKDDTPETVANSLAILQRDLVDPEFRPHTLAQSRNTQAAISGLLDEAVDAGELQKCDTTQLARAVQALVRGSLLQWAIDREGKASERLREDLDALLRPRHCPPRDRRRVARRTVKRV